MTTELAILLVQLFGPPIAHLLQALVEWVIGKLNTNEQLSDRSHAIERFQEQVRVSLISLGQIKPEFDAAEYVGTAFAIVRRIACDYGVVIDEKTTMRLAAVGMALKPS